MNIEQIRVSHSITESEMAYLGSISREIREWSKHNLLQLISADIVFAEPGSGMVLLRLTDASLLDFVLEFSGGLLGLAKEPADFRVGDLEGGFALAVSLQGDYVSIVEECEHKKSFRVKFRPLLLATGMWVDAVVQDLESRLDALRLNKEYVKLRPELLKVAGELKGSTEVEGAK